VQSVAELAPGVPSTLVHLVARCLEVDPARRTITAAEVAKELGEMARAQRGSSLPPLSSALASLPPTTLAPSAPSAPSRWPRALAVIALSLLAMTCLASVLAVVSMGGLAWVVGDAASSILEDVETVREASAAAAPTASPASPVAPPAADPRIGTAPPPAAGAPSTVPVGSAADAEGVSVSARVMGMSDGATERAIAEAARAAMGACRSERDESFDLELMWMGWGAMGLGTSNLTPHGRAPATPAEVCAQAAILDASHGQSSSGIVRFHVVLPAR
jgi:hypothetical protein